MPAQNVVIFGAGTVGTSVAEVLCEAHENVTLVDSSRRALDEVEERLDVRTVCGSACDAITLFQAGVQSALLCLAVTDRDEVNLIGGSLAKAMGSQRSVARVQNPGLRDASTFDYQRHFAIDRLLSLEYLTAVDLAKAIRTRGLFAVENLVRGAVEVQDVTVDSSSKAVGVPLKELRLPPNVRIGMITSGGRTVVAGANSVISAGDLVTLIGSHEALEAVSPMFQRRQTRRQNVIVAGGGEIGYNLARLLQGGPDRVVLMEADAARCEELAEKLDGVTVLHADATRQTELEEARVGKSDVFVATTGRDEDNIICGVEARELGARRILAVVRRPDYGNVLERLGIDTAVSPREVLAREVQGMVHPGAIKSASNLAGTSAQVWEVDVMEGAPVTRGPLKETRLRNALIAAIEREGFVTVPGADDQLQPGDVAVVLLHHDVQEETAALFEKAR